MASNRERRYGLGAALDRLAEVDPDVRQAAEWSDWLVQKAAMGWPEPRRIRKSTGENPVPAITSDALAQRIDPALAVDRALNAAERGAFLEHHLIGRYEGAQPADWIAEADNADAFLNVIEPWWERSGDKALAYMTTMYELPESLTKRLLTSALYATIAITSATLGDRDAPAARRAHIEIACGAALWVRGYAEALGWAPGDQEG